MIDLLTLLFPSWHLSIRERLQNSRDYPFHVACHSCAEGWRMWSGCAKLYDWRIQVPLSLLKHGLVRLPPPPPTLSNSAPYHTLPAVQMSSWSLEVTPTECPASPTSAANHFEQVPSKIDQGVPRGKTVEQLTMVLPDLHKQKKSIVGQQKPDVRCCTGKSQSLAVFSDPEPISWRGGYFLQRKGAVMSQEVWHHIAVAISPIYLQRTLGHLLNNCTFRESRFFKGSWVLDYRWYW